MIETWKDIPGFFDFQDIYNQAVVEAPEGSGLVEVGCFLGKSTVYMADRIKASGKHLSFFAVDSWNEVQYAEWWKTTQERPPDPWPVPELFGRSLFDAFFYCIVKAGGYASDNFCPIKVRRSLSTEAAKKFADQSLFFVFIDADHSYDAVISDIGAWWRKIKPGGIMAGHDYRTPDWPGVTRAVDLCHIDVEHRGNSWLVRKP